MADFQKGDFLILKDARYVDKEYLKNHSFHIFTGKYTHIDGLCPVQQLLCHDIILGRVVHHDQGTYSHFYRRMKPEEKKWAIEVINEIDYDFDEETCELIRKPITNIEQLKKRLNAFLSDPYEGSKSERDALTTAVNNLL